MPVLIALVHGLFLVLLALLTGFMAIVQWSLVPAQNRLDGPAYAVLEQGMNRVLERLTPALMIAGLVAGALTVAFALPAGGPRPWLTAAAVGGLGVMVASTLVVNAPVNHAIDGWDAAAPPSNWAVLRDRWEAGHAFRSYVGLLALACAVSAAVWPL